VKTAHDVVEVEVLAGELHGAGGFAQLRRLTVRNRRADGSASVPYALDLLERPGRADAVVVLPFERGAGAVRVLLREGLRPVPRLGRAGQPRRAGTPAPWRMIEAVAGILEAEDEAGEAGLRRRAALELEEEVGLAVDPDRVVIAGPPVLISAGMMAEEIFFCEVEAELDRLEASAGDGSCLEEGGEPVLLSLDEALARCGSGEIHDAKTELALRRLAARTGGAR
jgi:ADP-ribose pyrophosphatase